jgi:hypothetical protein
MLHRGPARGTQAPSELGTAGVKVAQPGATGIHRVLAKDPAGDSQGPARGYTGAQLAATQGHSQCSFKQGLNLGPSPPFPELEVTRRNAKFLNI